MKLRYLLAVVLVLVLSLGLVGCNLVTKVVETAATVSATTASGAVAETDATPASNSKTTQETAEPTADSSTSEAGTGSGQVDTSSLVNLADMNSYHLVQSGKFTDVYSDGTSSETTMNIEMWEVKEPRASRLIWSTQKDQEPASSLEMISIGTDTYMKSSDSEEWTTMSSSTPSDQSSFGDFGWFTDPSTVMNEQGKLIGVEDVNGVSAKHYQYSGNNVFAGVTGTAEISQADVWVSEEYNLVVKYSSNWQGTDEDGTQHNWAYNSEVFELNQPITIEPPAGVAKPGMPADVPLMEGATDISSFSGMSTFTVAATVDEVMAFYAKALPAQGWKAGEDSGVPGMANYTKDTRTLTIVASENGDTLSVSLLIQEQ